MIKSLASDHSMRWKVFLFVVIFVILWFIGNWYSYPTDWDDGVYLCSTRALAAGHPLYSDVFFAQTPLSISFLPIAFTYAGSNELSIRIVALMFSLLSLGGIGLLAYTIIGRKGVIVAMTLQAIQLGRCGSLWTCQAELPAMSLGLIAVGLTVIKVVPSRPTMVLVGVAFSLGMLCKVWIAPYVIAIILAKLRFPKSNGPRKAWFVESLISLFYASVSGLITAIFVISFYDIQIMYDQAIQFHIDALSVFNNQRVENMYILSRYFLKFAGITALALFGFAFTCKQRRIGYWLFIWIASSLAFLLTHTPLFEHHALLLIPPWALCATVALIRIDDWCAKNQIGRSLVFLIFGMLVFIDGRPEGNGVEFIGNTSRTQIESLDRPVIQVIQALSKEDELVGGDDQRIIFQARRMSPPTLCDTSFVRIRSGYLTTQEAISAAKQCKIIVLGTDRLNLLPGFQSWFDSRFQLVFQIGSRSIYLRRETQGVFSN